MTDETELGEADIRIVGVTPGFGGLAWWEHFIERLRWRGQPLCERWECWDAVQGRWRRYWRHNGSLPKWSDQ